MYTYLFYQRAARQYQEAVIWYDERSEETGDRFKIAVNQRIHDICANPSRYRNTYRSFYETSVTGFPYTIVYLIKAKVNLVIIASLYHHKRNPKKKYGR